MNSYGTRSDTDPKVFFIIVPNASPMAGPNSFSKSLQFSFKKMFILSPVKQKKKKKILIVRTSLEPISHNVQKAGHDSRAVLRRKSLDWYKCIINNYTINLKAMITFERNGSERARLTPYECYVVTKDFKDK